MLSKFLDRICFNTLFLLLAVLILVGSQMTSVFKRGKGGEMTESGPVLPQTIGIWTRPVFPKVVTAENIFDYILLISSCNATMKSNRASSPSMAFEASANDGFPITASGYILTSKPPLPICACPGIGD